MKHFEFGRLPWRLRIAALAAATAINWVVLGGVLMLFDDVSQHNAIELARLKAAPAASAVVAEQARKGKRG